MVPPILLLMDRRIESRFHVDESVQVTVLDQTQPVVAGRLVNLSGKGMRLSLDSEVPVGAPVRVDMDGTMLLGEVCYCYPEGATWALGLRLEHALTHSDDLARLMRQLVGDSTRGCGDLSNTGAPAHDPVRLRTPK